MYVHFKYNRFTLPLKSGVTVEQAASGLAHYCIAYLESPTIEKLCETLYPIASLFDSHEGYFPPHHVIIRSIALPPATELHFSLKKILTSTILTVISTEERRLGGTPWQVATFSNNPENPYKK